MSEPTILHEPERRLVPATLQDIARYDWGIEAPIELVPMHVQAAEHTDAYHIWRSEDDVHEISVRPRLHPRLLLECVAHEIQHAFQAELWACPVAWGNAYQAEREAFEEDARAAEHRWSEFLPALDIDDWVRERLASLTTDRK